MELKKIIAVRTAKTVYRDGGNVVKAFDKEYSKANVLNEALNQARVEETDLNIPKIQAVTMVDGKWAIVNTYIPGKTLETLMKENPDRYGEYLELFVDLQLKVFAQKCPLLNKLKDKMNRKIDETGLDATTRYDLHTRLEAMPKHNKVCHGDFNPSNVILREGDGEPFILDWSHATQGNASADAARTYLTFTLSGQSDVAEKYLALFCKKADIPKQLVQQWMPIVACSESTKHIPGEREVLDRWVNVFDFQ